MNELHNYKSTFDEPFRIKQLTDNFVLPFFINMANVVVYVIVLILLIGSHKLIVPLVGDNVPRLIIIYLGFPFLASKYITKMNPCGKKLHVYLYGILVYTKMFVLKEKYCHGKKVKYLGKVYRFDV